MRPIKFGLAVYPMSELRKSGIEKLENKNIA